MDQLLDQQSSNSDLKNCLESFEIVQANEGKSSKKNLYQYLLKKHFELEMNNDNRFSKKDIKHIPIQNMPLKKSKNISMSVLNPYNSQKTLQPESKQDQLSEKNFNDDHVKQEYEVLNLVRNEKQTYRARISVVYLDQPLLMIIFENQEIVKNNTKLKKQLAVSNNVLLNFFQEVNTKCNMLKQLIFNNEIFNAKFLFQLLQNNIYSIEQYLRKRGVDKTQYRQNSNSINNSYQHPLEASSFSPSVNKKQILKFQIYQEQKIIHASIDFAKLFSNASNKHKYLSKKSISSNTNNEEYMKRLSLLNGETTYQASNVCSTQVMDEKQEVEGKTASNSTNQLDELESSDTSFSKQKLGFIDEQNDFDYIDRIKINGNYNLDNLKKNFNKSAFNIQSNSQQHIENNERNYPQSVQNFSNCKIPERDDLNEDILNVDQYHFNKNSQGNIENKQPQPKNSHSSHKLSINNNNTSINADKQTNISQNITLNLNASNNNLINNNNNTNNINNTNNNQLAIKTLQNIKKLSNDQFLNANVIKSNSNMPSLSNASTNQIQNQPILLNHEKSQNNQEKITITEINLNTINNSKPQLRKRKSHNPTIAQEINRGNIKQFDFSEILEDIQIFKHEINIKVEQQLQQLKLYSDKDMIVYILRSLLSSVLVINKYRKKEATLYKVKTMSNLNQCISPELNTKKSLSKTTTLKKQLQKLQNDVKQNSSKDEDHQTHSYYSYNLENPSFQEPNKQIDTRQFFEKKREMSPMNQKQQYETNYVMKLKESSSNTYSPQNQTKLTNTNQINTNLELNTNENYSATKGNSNKSQHSQNTSENFMKKNEKLLQLNSQQKKNNEEKMNEIRKSNFLMHSNNKERHEEKGTLEDIQSQHVNFAEIKSESDQEQYLDLYGDDLEVDIPFDLYEVDMDFSLEKSKYCKSINVNLNNISKQELVSCLNLNTNKDVSKVEYEIIKLIIQKIGPYPLYYEARRVSFAFLLDLSEVIDGQSFFNLPCLDNQIIPSQQQEQILYQIPEEDGDIPQSLRKKQNTEQNEFYS